MPTGDLPGAAKTLHVSDEAIYLTIALFVVGFGVGPLLFAPRKFLRDSSWIIALTFFQYLRLLDEKPSIASVFSFTSSSPSHHVSLPISPQCWLVVW